MTKANISLPFQPLKSFLCHWTEIWRFRPTSSRSRNLFLGTRAKRKCHKHITKRNARDDRGATSPLLFFFAPRRTFSFLFILSAQNPPPPQICNDLFFYCLASSVNILFLYYLASLSQKYLSLLSCPTSTIIFSIVLPSTYNLILLSSPQKSFPPSYPPLVHLSSLASLTTLLESRWMCGHAALSVPNPHASCLAVRCTRFLGIFAAERSTYASFPIQYSVSVDFRFTTLFTTTWQRYYSV